MPVHHLSRAGRFHRLIASANKKPPMAWEAVVCCFAALCPPKPLESSDNHEDDKEDENEDAAASFAHDSFFRAVAKATLPRPAQLVKGLLGN